MVVSQCYPWRRERLLAHFNIGAQAAVGILKEVNLEPGKFCVYAMNKINKARIERAVVTVLRG